MANAPIPRGGRRQQIAVRARRAIALTGITSLAVHSLVLLSTGPSSIVHADEAGQWRPRKTSSDSSTWSPDAAGRLLGDTSATRSTRWLPSNSQTPLAKPADQTRGKPSDQARPASPQLPRYAALRAEIDAIHADFSNAVDSNADPRQFDLILVRAYRVQDDAQTPSERALADELFKRIAKYDVHTPQKSRADRSSATRTWLNDLSAEASGLGTLIFTGHDEAKSRPQKAAVQHAASPQQRADDPIASNSVRGALSRLMSSGLPVSYRDSDVRPASATSPVENSTDRASNRSRGSSEPAPFFAAGTTQRVTAVESSSRPLPTPPVQAAPTVAEQIPLLKQLGGWWRSRTPRVGRDER
jgi:hypothetical protein